MKGNRTDRRNRSGRPKGIGNRNNHRLIDGVMHRRCKQCMVWQPETSKYFKPRVDGRPWNSPCIACMHGTKPQQYDHRALDAALNPDVNYSVRVTSPNFRKEEK